MSLDQDRLAELRGERQFLLESLADLEREHDAGDLDEADYAALRDGYTARAAAVLRELDGVSATSVPAVSRRRWGRTVAWVVGSLALAVGAGLLVARSSGQRLPGDVGSGDVAESVNNLLIEARGLQVTDPRQAIDTYDEVLKVQPDNAEALTYRGWMLVRVGSDAVDRGVAGGEQLVTAGEQGFDRAIAARPTYADPYCFKAITRFRFFGDAAGAKAPVDTCLASNPPQVVLGLVQNLSAEIDAALAGPPASGPTASTVAPVATTG